MIHMATETRLDLCCRIKAVLATLDADKLVQIARIANVDHYPLTAEGWNTDRAQIRAMGDGIREGTGKRRHMEDKGEPWTPERKEQFERDMAEFSRRLSRDMRPHVERLRQFCAARQGHPYTPVTCPDHGEGGE